MQKKREEEVIYPNSTLINVLKLGRNNSLSQIVFAQPVFQVLSFFSYASVFDVFMTNELLKNFCSFVLSSLSSDHILKLLPKQNPNYYFKCSDGRN